MTLPLNTAPGPSPDEESRRHAEISRDFLVRAQQELERGNAREAASLARYAVESVLKAVGEKRGLSVAKDWEMRKSLFDLMDELDDSELWGCYIAVRHADLYFCLERYELLDVRHAVRAAGDLIHKLDSVLSTSASYPR